jgi:hypothetical protein
MPEHQSFILPSVRGRAVEGGRGSVTRHPEWELSNTPEGRGYTLRRYAAIPNKQMPWRFRYRRPSDSKERSRFCGNACVPQSSRRLPAASS